MQNIEFKILYNNLIKENNIENQNLFLRYLVKYCRLFVGVKDGYLSVVRIQENNSTYLNIYTNEDEIKEENGYQTMDMEFDTIVSTVNANYMDGIIINPYTDNFVITNAQLMDLTRQKYYCASYNPMLLHDCNGLRTPAYETSQLDNNSNKIVELYQEYLQNKDEVVLSQFYNELVNDATFFISVLPEANAEKNEQGYPIISEKRIYQYGEDNDKYYILFITRKKAQDVLPLDQQSHLSILNFEDIIKLIDSTHDVIKSIRIKGDIEIVVPVETLNNLKIQKDMHRMYKDADVMSGKYANTEENRKLENKLKELFSKINNIEKVWLGLEVYFFNGKENVKVNKIQAKVNGDIDENINNELDNIFKNECFEYIITENDIEEDNSKKLIYSK